jgi:hypothetical protein
MARLPNCRDFLTQMTKTAWVISSAKCGLRACLNEPGDERGKSFFEALLDVFFQQNAVVQFQHLQVNAADQGKVTGFRKKIALTCARMDTGASTSAHTSQRQLERPTPNTVRFGLRFGGGFL